MTERIENPEEEVEVKRTKEGDGTWQNPGDFPEMTEEIITQSDEQVETKLTVEEVIAKLEELKEVEAPEGKFKIPAECIDREIEHMREFAPKISDPNWPKRTLDRIEKLCSSVDRNVGEKLWALYSDPDISLGIHGTIAATDSDYGTERSPFFKDGLGCRREDMRRTVAFQDYRFRGHGEISFFTLLDYNYPSCFRKERPLTVARTVLVKDGKVSRFKDIDVPAKQYGVIVTIPKSFGPKDSDLRGKEIEIQSNIVFNPGETVVASVLKPEFIVGVTTDSNPNTIVWNPGFDADHLRALSKQREIENQAREEQKRLAVEQEKARKDTEHDRGFIGKFLKKFGRK